MGKSLVLSPAGSFTAVHMDAYGMQGWMYLIEGRKTWAFYPPRHALAAFDPVCQEFHDRRRHRPEQFPMLPLADRYIAEYAMARQFEKDLRQLKAEYKL